MAVRGRAGRRLPRRHDSGAGSGRAGGPDRGGDRRRSGPRRRRALVGVLAALVFSTMGCSGGSGLVVGSKNFTEQDLLGEIVAQWIEARLGLPVERRLHLGGSFIAHRALVAGDLDLYVEYTGTAYTAVLERSPIHDRDSVFRAVARAYRERWDIEWLPPLGFENTFAILVREGMADSLGITRLGELAPYAPDLRAGFGYEFMQREDGYPGLVETYGLEFAEPPRDMDLGLVYRALAEGRVDLTAGNSTDGRIEALDLLMLEDDRGYFPPYEAAIAVRAGVLARHDGLRAALEELSGALDTRTMRRLDAAVDLEGRDYETVAAEWIRARLSSAGSPSAMGSDSGPTAP